MRIWGKIWKDNHMIHDLVVCDESQSTRTHKVFHAIEKIVYEFDLSTPIWLDSNIKHFQRLSRVRFNQDSFIEQIDFDYLEIQVLEED